MNEADSRFEPPTIKVKRKWKALDTPSKESLWERFNYDPETGKLFHRINPPDSQFGSSKLKERHVKRFGGKEAGSKKVHIKTKVPTGIYVRLYPNRHMAHRLIWVMVHGSIPSNMMVDHINGDPYDNRIENLRLVGSAENQWNAKRSRKEGTGVAFVRGKYSVVSSTRKLTERLGRFDTLEEAVSCYLEHAENREKCIGII